MRLTSENTALVLDSGSDLADAADRERNWRVVPAYVYLGGKSYRDGVDLTPEDFYRRLRSGREHPRTSQPSPGDFEEVFAELEEFDRVLVVTASSKLSGIHGSALVAAQVAPDRIRVFDSCSVSGTVALLADALQRRLERGTDDDEIALLVARFQTDARYLCALDTIDYLVRGGRVGKAAGLAAGLARIRPIVQVADGEIAPLRRVRGRSKLLPALERVFADETEDVRGLHVGIAHADALPDAERLVESVRAMRPRASLDFFGLFGPGVGSHSGPGAVALFWFHDEVDDVAAPD